MYFSACLQMSVIKSCFFNHAPVKRRKSPGLSHYLSCPNTSVLASSSSCLSSRKKAKILDMCSGFHHPSWEILLLKASSLIPIALISPHGLLLIIFTHSSFPNFTKAFTWQSRPLATLHENKHIYTSEKSLWTKSGLWKPSWLGVCVWLT